MPINVGGRSYRIEAVLQNSSFKVVLSNKCRYPTTRGTTISETQVIDRLLKLSREIGSPVYRDWAALVDSIILEIDRPIPSLVEYPFPTEPVPRFVYRWCSQTEAQIAQAQGIVKTGSVHDGIPTLGTPITRQKAATGGGMGMRCLRDWTRPLACPISTGSWLKDPIPTRN